jgi:hypothetical protein
MMRLFNFFFKKKDVDASLADKHLSKTEYSDSISQQPTLMEQRIALLYEQPENLVELEFSNRTNRTIHIWVELACVSIDLDGDTEYKIVSHDRYFRIEFDKNNDIVLYLQYSFGFKLCKRLNAQKGHTQQLCWELKLDLSHIN